MKKTINIAIIGANGYGGAELVRILDKHPNVNIKLLISRSLAGQKVADTFPHLRDGLVANDGKPMHYASPEFADWQGIDLCFFATPHTVAMGQSANLLAKGIKIIDLSADFRIKSQLIWEQWYGTRHTEPELIKKAIYGLPELNREAIKSAQLIACPGCYPTSVQLGLMPLLQENLITENIIADVKSGISGAGRSAKVNMLYCERSENFEAYATHGHRHYPEIKQQLEIMAGHDVDLIFTPHLVPMSRGIHATIYAKLKHPDQDIQQLFESHYQNEPFVDILPIGSHPQTKSVTGTNMLRLAITRPPHSDYITILAVEDNLIKGAAGQAIQCMNLMYDLTETIGLTDLARI